MARRPIRHFGSTQDLLLDPGDHEATLYHCAGCDQAVGAEVVADMPGPGGGPLVIWMVCPVCGRPATRDQDGRFSPVPLAGDPVRGLPSQIASAYQEARLCAAAEAFSACEMLCRKILMYVAVQHGAPAGKQFTAYVDHLLDEGLLTRRMFALADVIRINANRASHELPESSADRALQTLRFCTNLLRLAYELELDAQATE